MTDPSQQDSAATAIKKINEAWLTGDLPLLESALHPEVVMVLPDFAGRMQGREQLVAGFRDFVDNAVVHKFHDHDAQVDVVGNTAVVSFQFEMVYERDGARYRSTGRDLWVLQKEDAAWVAVWRTMLDLKENRE
ncbi:MAG TPA: nuclear transport factor 2 family protein [Blastocatellia bacterium]|nr:nuclear transport factor 2 family protein [Blastocatellia bacterium]